MPEARFIHGTAGWSYKDWVGPFYPENVDERDFLSAYSGIFSAVEVDSTYYRIPPARMTEAWERKTPDDFLFSPKMVGEVTHERFLENCGELVEKFLEGVSPLGPKLGPVVLQFPYFRKAQGITLDIFLERLLPFLDSLPDGPRFAVETRNRTFLKPKLLDALRERKTALVLIDHVWMPRPAEWLKIEGIFTADYVPIRLLGDRYAIEKVTKTWDKVVVDRSERLQGWAELIAHAMKSGLDVQAFANNHFAGHGPATIRELADLVAKGPEATSSSGDASERTPRSPRKRRSRGKRGR